MRPGDASGLLDVNSGGNAGYRVEGRLGFGLLVVRGSLNTFTSGKLASRSSKVCTFVTGFKVYFHM